MHRVSQAFVDRINKSEDVKTLQTELDHLEEFTNGPFFLNISKEINRKIFLIKERIAELMKKSNS